LAVGCPVPQYLKEVPIDPFDGKPLRLRRLSHGLVIFLTSRLQVPQNANLQAQESRPRAIDIVM
jgi:hypothetical protein